MKKTFKYMAAMVIVGMFLSTSAIGQTTATGKNYVDKDKNGVCDNRTVSKGNSASGRNFTDANNDGMCDNRQSAGKEKGKGCGQKQQGCRNRGGNK
jgi:hypothetical protein